MDTAKTLTSRRLFTWFDVDLQARQSRAAGAWPKWMTNFSAYSDGVVVTVQRGTKPDQVQEFLSSMFGARFDPTSPAILFESSIDQQQRSLPVEIDELNETEAVVLPVEPTFKRVSLIPDDFNAMEMPSEFPTGTPALIAFYSFKGGVGRTTHLLALLKALSARNLRTLVIDADLEAPGITSLVNSDKILPGSPFSLLDFLALAHTDATSQWESTLALASEELSRNILQIADGKTSPVHYFLPAFRDLDQSLALDIKPEHLIGSRGAEWDVGNLFAALGRRMGVAAVLIDLRTGLSELASPFLLDGRMRRLIVSTPSSQSIEGTVLILKEMSKLVPRSDNQELERDDLFDPSIILSFVNADLAASAQIGEIEQRLISNYPDSAQEEPISRLVIYETSFAGELLYLNSLADAMKKLDGSSVEKVMADIATEILTPEPLPQLTAIFPSPKIDDLRSSISNLARRMEYAESGAAGNFLSIAPLRLLAQHFRVSPALAVVVGAKGSGKTFTYMQLARSQDWSKFANAALRDEHGRPANGKIWPLLQSKNLDDSARRLVNACRQQTASTLGLKEAALSSLAAEDAIRESLTHSQADLTWWRHRWLSVMANSLGIPHASENMAVGLIVDFLRKKGEQLIVIIDGLEDLFPELERMPPQQIALRALLQEIPALLREIVNCPLGILVFIRADLVSAAISQNEGQFRRLYEPYSLRWNEEEALRLAAWIAKEAGAPLDLPGDRKLETISSDEAKQALVPIWGWKLGISEKAREARTAEWVIAALSDFRGQVQARDLVRLFRYAAEKSKSNPAERVLIPRAIRDAIQPCSEEKIKEIEQEIPPLKAIFAKLQKATERKIPFDAVNSGLTVQEIRFLEATGVLIEDRGEYFMPEIFRLGLGFQLAQGARPRVLSLARRAVGKQLRQNLPNM